ncbi:MAG: GDP-mannose 4,6-dehydratase [Candidatus Levybacteria bacterium]|nr:GDP-mannose 4,6-dehydratase [Candidatus Levybacteria bacterium]
MLNVLVTGGAGFIGSHLCRRLLEEGHTVYCIDTLLTSSESNINPLKDNPHFKYIKHDVIQPLDETKHNIFEIDAIFHLASPASPNHHSPLSYHALPMETMMVNTVGTHELLKLAQKHKAKFLFASTSEAYGDPLEHPQKETYRGNVSTTGPRSVYDEAKRFGETLTAYYERDKDLDTRIVRIFNTYGPNMQEVDKRMIVNFIVQALANEQITIFGDGKQTRSLCYVDDTVEGIMRLMFYPKTKGEVVNIGSAGEHTVLEYAEIIKKLTNSSSEIIFSEDLPLDDPLKRKADIAKAKKLLDWEPKVTLKDGLQKIIEFFRQSHA